MSPAKSTLRLSHYRCPYLTAIGVVRVRNLSLSSSVQNLNTNAFFSPMSMDDISIVAVISFINAVVTVLFFVSVFNFLFYVLVFFPFYSLSWLNVLMVTLSTYIIWSVVKTIIMIVKNKTEKNYSTQCQCHLSSALFLFFCLPVPVPSC